MRRVEQLKKILLVFLVCNLISFTAYATKKSVGIAILADGQTKFFEQIRKQAKSELMELLGSEFDISFPEGAQIIGDWTATGISAGFDGLMADKNVDLIITIGVLASGIACAREDLKKPVVASMVNAESSIIPFEKGISGRKNLNYLAHPWGFKRDLKVFSDIFPYKKLAFVVSDYLLKSEGTLPVEERLSAIAKLHTDDFVVVGAGQSAKKTLDAIPPDVDGVYIVSLVQMEQSEVNDFVQGLMDRKLPSFSMMGRVHVEQGIMAGLRSKDDVSRVPRQVAINVQRILLGEEAGQIPVAFSTGSRLVINVRTTRNIAISPPFRVLIEAEIVGEEELEGARTLTYSMIIEEALRSNLELALAHHNVLIGRQEQPIARGNLLPGLDVGTNALLIDSDRAEAAMGSQPQFSWTASATLKQVLAEGAFANYAVQGHLQNARELKEEEIKLDIIEAALIAYLNVLQARVGERIHKNNVRLSRSNLDLAHKRIMIGVSNSSEEYRWESLIAHQKQDVVNSQLRSALASLELNRLLNQPLVEEFVLEEVGLESSIFGIVEGRILELTDNPKSMQVFSNFIAKLAFENSSQLKQIKKSMEAVKRTIASTKRSFWLPTFAVQGQAQRSLVKEGEGTEGLDLSAMGMSTAKQDDTNFSISALLSWSVFEGGQRVAELRKYRAQLVQLEVQFEATKQLIEQRLRAALWNGRASGISIVLAHNAAQASKKNLELVTDAYSRGALTILDLLDAQNTALVSELAAANARFTLMIDMIKIQRAAEVFFAVEGKENTTKRIRQLEEYLKKHDAMPAIRGDSPFEQIQ